jgi:hypothetical protein
MAVRLGSVAYPRQNANRLKNKSRAVQGAGLDLAMQHSSFRPIVRLRSRFTHRCNIHHTLGYE